MKINTFFDFCSGIGGGRLGLEQAGLYCVGYSDTAKLAPITYNLMFNTNGEKNYGNLKRIDTKLLPKFDMLIAGFPCQTFSVIGRKDGFSDDRGLIIFHLARIIKETKPKCFLLENVKGLVTHDKGKTLNTILKELDDSGYNVTYKVLTSLDYGIPQMRQRVYFVGIRKDYKKNIEDFAWPSAKEPAHLEEYLIDNHLATPERLKILEYYLNNPTNSGKYTIKDLLSLEGQILDTRMNDLRIYNGKCPTLRAQRDGILYVKNGKIHQLTGYEALLLQGFPKEYADKVKDKVTDRHLLMQAGNAMTVNVINEIAKSIISFFNDNKEMAPMNPGEEFEKRCYEYLKRMYNNVPSQFECKGGMDSTTSDIAVLKGNHVDFYIEAKSPSAQSGQFVLLPNETTKTFVFSPRNKSEQNEMTNIIIDYMNQDFDRFNNAGTAGERLDIDTNVFSGWIVEHYKDKNVKYFISHDNDYIIFPIRRFADYFKIIANFRIKKSGSSDPAVKNINDIKAKIKELYPSATFSLEDSKLFVTIDTPLKTDRFQLGNYTYYFSVQSTNRQYRIKKLSNTYNMNVIFQIQLIKGQDDDDLLEFESDL